MYWLKMVVLGGLVLAGVGCANLTSINRYTDYPRGKGEQEGRAIHLDAKQRVVFSDASGLCAEPSPDALSATASSFGGGIAVPSQAAISFAQALQESSASIGLRTQSITLMRDTLYRICEMYHNKALSAADVIQLLERSQDLTLGVLAIEQLTGAVVARQVVLGGGANASASANLGTTQAQLNNARKNEANRKKDLDTATAEQKKQSDLVSKTTADLKAAQGQAKPDQTEIDRLTALQKTQQAKLETDNQAVADATKSYKEAQEVTQKIEDNFNSASTVATAAANGFGSFATAIDRVTIDKDTAKAIAEAVDSIVTRVVNKGHLTDTCINLMSRYATDPAKFNQGGFDTAMKYCDGIIKTTLRVYEAQSGLKHPPPPAAIQ